MFNQFILGDTPINFNGRKDQQKSIRGRRVQKSFKIPLFQIRCATANDNVPDYTWNFGLGMNQGWHGHQWNDNQMGDIMIGNPGLSIDGIGMNSLRLTLPEYFLDQWGYNVRYDTYDYYGTLGAEENVIFIEGPSASNIEPTIYCTGNNYWNTTSSRLWKNLYEPIFDSGGETPVNENNLMAYYVYRVVNQYGHRNLKFWEIINEPDFSWSWYSWYPRGEFGNWWENDPDPCDLTNLLAPIQHYVRALRISYEVIKSLYPDQFVCIGGIGYPSFLDAVLRNTDNPVDGSVTSEYPLFGGAYFDCLSYHSYPMFDVAHWNDSINDFTRERHSDKCVDAFFGLKDEMEVVLSDYGYDGSPYPVKHVIVTETNIPSVQYETYIGSVEAQINYIIKIIAKATSQNVDQIHFYALSTYSDPHPSYNAMGFYENLNAVNPYDVVELPSGFTTKTTHDMIVSDQTYDAAETSNLNLPNDIEGFAFKDSLNEYTYVLWARTNTDMSETRELTYTFPTSYNTQTSYTEYDWEWSSTGISSYVIIDQYPISINVHGSPIFIRFGNGFSCPPGFCKNGGTCDGNDHCACINDWTEDDCTGFTCSPGYCKNGGTCNAPEHCSCIDDWTGSDCTDFSCSSGFCKNGGTCNAPEHCSCINDWEGDDCASFSCSSGFCKNGGTCNAPEHCSCINDWTGDDCTEFSCSSGFCKNGGTCNAPEHCSCINDWTGDDCTEFSCSPGFCKNGGTCNAPEHCSCINDWTGDDCTGFSCSSGFCKNGGTCNGPEHCSCINDWEGDDCASFSCPTDFCKHDSSCIAPSKCQCVGNYFGDDCSQIYQCDPVCQNSGICDSPDHCTCVNDWTGVDCTGFSCTVDFCQNGGTCNGPQKCSCVDDWTGVDCTQFSCSTDFCKNGGTCDSPEHCNCINDWTGDDCSVFSCSSGFCQNGGVCNKPEHCACINGWTSSDCTGFSCTPDDFCQNDGTCNSPMGCSCINGFSGKNCSIAPSYIPPGDSSDDGVRDDGENSPTPFSLGLGGTIGVSVGAGVMAVSICALMACLLCCFVLCLLCCVLCIGFLVGGVFGCGSSNLLKVSKNDDDYRRLEVDLEEKNLQTDKSSEVSYPSVDQFEYKAKPRPTRSAPKLPVYVEKGQPLLLAATTTTTNGRFNLPPPKRAIPTRSYKHEKKKQPTRKNVGPRNKLPPKPPIISNNNRNIVGRRKLPPSIPFKKTVLFEKKQNFADARRNMSLARPPRPPRPPLSNKKAQLPPTRPPRRRRKNVPRVVNIPKKSERVAPERPPARRRRRRNGGEVVERTKVPRRPPPRRINGGENEAVERTNVPRRPPPRRINGGENEAVERTNVPRRPPPRKRRNNF